MDGGGFPAAAVPQKRSIKGDPLLGRYLGKVLVLLMGKPGCPGTEKAMPFLEEFDGTKPEGVALLRLDVPPEGGTVEKPRDLPPGFPYAVDKGRKTAQSFNFFFYPTLFIFDRDGVLRYRGGCDPGKVKKITAALMAEKEGAPKEDFSASLPARGERAADFEGRTIDGASLSFSKLVAASRATLLIFSSTNCPFSKKAMKGVKGLEAEFRPLGVSFVIVNAGSGAGAARPFYRRTTPGVPVVVDADNAVSGGLYGVQTVPFFFAVDKGGVIAYGMPFDEETARAALRSVLGLSRGPVKAKARGGG